MLAAALGVAAAIASGCSEPDAPAPKEREMIAVYQASADPGDPHICSDSAARLSVLFSIYDALLEVDGTGAYRPGLAERWTVSEDARTWTFTLREGVRFHNGEPLRAEDVVASLRRVLDPAIGGSFGTQGVYLSYLAGAVISRLDDRTVRIAAGEPLADLPDLVSAMPIAPANALSRLPGEYIGTGPYRVAERSADRIVLEAFDRHWNGPPPYAGITWVGEPEAKKRVDALLGGRADIVAGVEEAGRERILGSPDVALHRQESGLCVIFMLNAFEGACTDRRVRQALNHALDVDAIIAGIMPGAAARLNGYLTPHHFGHDPETPPYSHDPAKARELLAEAGYSNGLKLVFDIPSTMPDEAPRLAALMREQLAAAGIALEIVEHADRAAYSEMVRDKKIHDACCFDSSPRSTFRVLREKLQSKLRGPWWQGYANPEVDTLIARAQATLADGERQAIYRKIYRIVRDDAPWIFLYRPTSFWGTGPRMAAWSPRPDGLLLFE